VAAGSHILNVVVVILRPCVVFGRVLDIDLDFGRRLNSRVLTTNPLRHEDEGPDRDYGEIEE